MIGRWHLWLLTHPRVGRPLTVLAGLWGLALTAVTVAPNASASTNGILLDWTGLHDSQGVAPGDYLFAMASVRDQILHGSPDIGLDPTSWLQWMGHTLAVVLANVTAANILTGEAGFFIGAVTLALWLFRLTVSTYWLTVVGEIARAITAGVVEVTTRLGLIALAVPVGVFIGVLTMHRGERGRGATMTLLAVTMPALSVAVFADPTDRMYGPDGVLAFARRVGFSVAEAGTHDGAVGSGGFDAQVDTLTASILTHTVREPLQLWNFGHVVDRVGGCGAAWSAAVRHGNPQDPVAAMTACGDRAAVAYVQHLDGSNIWSGLVLVACSLLLGSFMVTAGWAVLKVSIAAVWTTATLLPALWIGGIPGAPQKHAIETVWRFFRHGIEVLVYVVFVSVIGLAIERLVAQPLPAPLGGNNPFAHVLMMGACCVAAFALLRHVRGELSGGGPARPGIVGRGADVAVGLGLQAALGGAGGAVAGRAKGLSSRRGGGERPPWEQLESAATSGPDVHGEPHQGFVPVPGGEVGGGSEPATSGGHSNGPADGNDVGGKPDSGGARSSWRPTGASSQAPIDGSASHPEPTDHARPDLDRVDTSPDPGEPANTVDPVGTATPHPAVPVDPMLDWPTTGHGEDIAPNLDPPQDDGPGQSGDEPGGVDPLA